MNDHICLICEGVLESEKDAIILCKKCAVELGMKAEGGKQSFYPELKQYIESLLRVLDQYRIQAGDYRYRHFFATMSRDGRLTVPIEIRKIHKLKEGAVLSVLIDDQQLDATKPVSELSSKEGKSSHRK